MLFNFFINFIKRIRFIDYLLHRIKINLIYYRCVVKKKLYRPSIFFLKKQDQNFFCPYQFRRSSGYIFNTNKKTPTSISKPRRFLTLFSMVIPMMMMLSIAVILAFLTIGYKVYVIWNNQQWNDLLTHIIEYDDQINTEFYDVNNNLIGSSYKIYSIYTEYQHIPQQMIDAIVSVEDRNFFTHHGIDYQAILRAAIYNIRSGKITQGGSTITQQLVRFHLLTREKKFSRKFKEIILAIKLEQLLSKQKILEHYLNRLFLGNNTHGIAGAAHRIFKKELKDLDIGEYALIAGLFQAPSRYNPLANKKAAKHRQIQVLSAMLANNKITINQYNYYKNQKLDYSTHSFSSLPGMSSKATSVGYYLDYVTNQAKKILKVPSIKGGGYRIYTHYSQQLSDIAVDTLNKMSGKYSAIELTYNKTLGTVKLTNNHNNQQNSTINHYYTTPPLRIEASVVILNRHTGAIEAMIGGRDYLKSNFNRVVQSLRSPGSAFKPVVYSYALSHGYKWSDVFFLSPISLSQDYKPRTQQHEYLKEATLIHTFYKSVNVTSFELGKKLGIDNIIAHAHNLGIKSPIKKEYGSLIGQSEVTQMDMVRLYSTFSNQGAYIDPIVISHITDLNGKILYRARDLKNRSHQVLTPQINYLMINAMNKVLSHGTAIKAASLSKLAAGKTGTSNNSNDNWFCGFSQDYVMIVWVGPDSHLQSSIRGISGSSVALPLWKSIFEKINYLTADRIKISSGFFEAPTGLTMAYIDPRYGHKSISGIKTWFLNGSMPSTKPSTLNVINSHQPIRGFGSK